MTRQNQTECVCARACLRAYTYMGDITTGKESRCPGEIEARKTEIAIYVCINSDLERVGEE